MSDGPNNYLQTLLASATDQFPYIRPYNLAVTQGKDVGDYAETWPAGEAGTEDQPRPSDLPADRNGVEVMRPDKFGPSDLAAEVLHIDPFAHATRNILANLLTPGQTRTLKHESGDYAQSIEEHETPAKALDNAIDSAMRGYTTGQWPAEANAAMNYSPQQTNILQSLMQYMHQGFYPSDYNLPGK